MQRHKLQAFIQDQFDIKRAVVEVPDLTTVGPDNYWMGDFVGKPGSLVSGL